MSGFARFRKLILALVGAGVPAVVFGALSASGVAYPEWLPGAVATALAALAVWLGPANAPAPADAAGDGGSA